MARTFLCIPCSLEFPTAGIYEAHKKSGHTAHLDQASRINEPPIPTPPPGIPQDAMPTPEFVQMVSRIESDKERPATSPALPEHPLEIPPPTPLTLAYIWRGQCPACYIEAATFELDVAGQHFCLAVCPICKKQLDTKEVAKL